MDGAGAEDRFRGEVFGVDDGNRIDGWRSKVDLFHLVEHYWRRGIKREALCLRFGVLSVQLLLAKAL